MVVSNKNISVRLFKNPILEYFSHIHPAIPFIAYLPVIGYFGYQTLVQNHPILSTTLMFSGIIIWTLLEYTMHRFAFHFPAKSELTKRMVFLSHGVHHDYPRDATRLVMPLLVSVPLAFFFYYLFQYSFGQYANGLYTGLVAGYLAYDFLHFSFHHFKMEGKVGSWLKLYHLRHHYNDSNSGFGVSNPLWDYVFRTAPKNITEKRKAELLKSESDEKLAA